MQTPRVGEIAFHDTRSTLDFTVEDKLATERKRKEAAAAVLSVYDQDTGRVLALRQRVLRLLKTLRNDLDRWLAAKAEYERAVATVTAAAAVEQGPEGTPAPVSPTPAPTAELPVRPPDREEFLAAELRMVHEVFDVPLTREQLRALLDEGVSGEIEAALLPLSEETLRVGIVADRALLLQEWPRAIVLRDLETRRETEVRDLRRFFTLREARERIRTAARDAFPDNLEAANAAATIFISQLEPNVRRNDEETQRRREAARRAVSPVTFQVRRGEMLIRDGDRYTPETVLKVSRLIEMQVDQSQHSRFLGTWIVIALLWLLLLRFLRTLKMRSDRRFECIVLLGVLLLGGAVTNGFFLFLGRRIAGSMSSYPYDLVTPYMYAAPYAAGPLMATLLVHPGAAMIVALMMGVHSGMLAGDSLQIGIFALIASMIGSLAVRRYRQRSAVLYAGLIISLGNAGTVLALSLRDNALLSFEASFAVLCSLIGGLLTTMVVTLLLPLLETLFDITTDIRLLELSSSEHPLLRQLALRAPGSYHHSLLVGALAEAAAEAINANALLAKVASYYHDIGKIEKSEYFIENQRDRSNPHDGIGSNLSKLILISHVKKGVELARQHNLGREITDIIAEHHGDSVIRFFYAKALRDNNEDSSITEENFRYPGPRPRTKVAAIIMLSDCVEAAARTVENQHPGAVRAMVEKIAAEKFLDHQFDDCELTFKELITIRESLIETILKYRHQRIAYPEAQVEQPRRGQRAAEPAGEEPSERALRTTNT